MQTSEIVISRKQWYSLQIAVLLINVVLKFIFLTSNSVSLDEPFSIYHAQLEPATIIRELSLGNNPPLFELILHYWIEQFGNSAFSVRFLPCVFSCLSALVLFRMVSTQRGITAGFLTAVAFTLSTYHIQFAHEARVYSLFCLLTICAYHFFLKTQKQPDKKLFPVLWILSLVLLCYSHYLGFIVPVIQALSLFLITGINKKTVKLIEVMTAVLFVAYLPWLKILSDRLTQTLTGGTWVAASNAEDLYNSIWSFSNSPLAAIIFITMLTGALLLSLIKKQKADPFTLHAAIWFFVPLLTMFVMSWSALPIDLPIFVDRYLIFFSPAFYVLVTIAGINITRHFSIHRSAAIIPCILMAAKFNANPDNKRHVKEMIEAIESKKNSNTTIVFAPENFKLNLLYYLEPEIFKSTDEKNIYSKTDSLMHARNIYGVNISEELQYVPIDPTKQLIYIDAGSSFMWKNNGVKDTLSSRMTLSEEQKFPAIFTMSIFNK